MGKILDVTTEEQTKLWAEAHGAWAKATRYSRRLIPTCHVTAGRNGKRRPDYVHRRTI